MKKNVAVIGAGVSGITTAVLLQNLGFKVSVYSKELPFSSKNSFSYASKFPSASIIPHSVFHPNLDHIFEESQVFFSTLQNSMFSGLLKHEHFELFAFENKIPNYAKKISGFKEFTDTVWHPKHPGIKIKSGWKFDCFFADWTLYFPTLLQSFIDKKGIFITEEVDLNSFDKVNEDIIINCSGIGSNRLSIEKSEPLILLGHLLKIKNTPSLLSPSEKPVSYNFSPGIETYSDSFNTAFDVYVYPRETDWILGGSRFRGTLDKNGKWVSRDAKSIHFPEQIKEINAQILKHSFGIDLEVFKSEEQIALRYVRNSKNGLRIEKDENYDRLVIHNYGHGGAGVTLSWGAAYEVYKIISSANKAREYSIEDVLEKISTHS